MLPIRTLSNGTTAITEAHVRSARALELCKLVIDHPACPQETRYEAEELCRELVAKLPPDVAQVLENSTTGWDTESRVKALVTDREDADDLFWRIIGTEQGYQEPTNPA